MAWYERDSRSLLHGRMTEVSMDRFKFTKYSRIRKKLKEKHEFLTKS